MASFLDRCIFNATSTGTGSFVVASAATGYLTPAQANAVDATTYHYAAETRDANNTITNWEVGLGTYASGTVTLARTSIIFSSNANAAVNFTTVPVVMVCATATDVANLNTANTFTASPNVIPLIAGGAGAASTLTLESTTGSGTTDMILLKTHSQNETMRIDTNGNISFASWSGGYAPANGPMGGTPVLNTVTGAGAGKPGLAIFTVNDSAPVSAIQFLKTRADFADQYTVVQNNDTILSIIGYGASGSDYDPAVAIVGTVNGTPGANDMPGRLGFWTSPDGSATLGEWQSIEQDGTTRFSGAVYCQYGPFPLTVYTDQFCYTTFYPNGNYGCGFQANPKSGGAVTFPQYVTFNSDYMAFLGPQNGGVRFGCNDGAGGFTVVALTVTALGNVVCNAAAITTSAADGFLYVPTCAGTPTGTPTTFTGRAPIIVNTTNNKLYFYSTGAWRDAGP